MAFEALLGANGIHRQLQRAGTLRRRRQLVVDQPHGAVGQQVEPVGDAVEENRPRLLGPDKLEFALEAVFEQALDDGHRLLRLHPENRVREAGRHGRAEQPRPFERGFCFWQRRNTFLHDLRKQGVRAVKAIGSDRAVPPALPLGEESTGDAARRCRRLLGSITSSSSGSSSRRRTCCAKYLNGQARYVSMELTDSARGGRGPADP